jgi:hypothetical protein
MADNALAPSPINALTTAARKYSGYQDLLNFLGVNQPPISFTPIDDEQIRGQYKHGRLNTDPGSIQMNSNYLRNDAGGARLPESAVRTLVHETVHATDSQLANLYSKYKDRPPTPEMAQFVEGYKKMRWNMENPNANYQMPPSESLARRLDPRWAAENANYRANENEMYARAVGNTSRAPGTAQYRSDAPLHLDPTLATEHFILLDIANRAQKSLLPK